MKALLTKTLAVLLSAMLLFTAVPFAASAAATAEQQVGAKSGTTGDCTWTLDNNGTLTISGNGAMEDYAYEEVPHGGENDVIEFTIPTLPWERGIKCVIIEDGVTSIGALAFHCCDELTSVTIPDSVTSIGSEAFSGCTGLRSITMPDGVTSIGWDAFYNTAWYNSQPDGVVYAGKVAYKYKGTMPANTSIVLKDGTTEIAGSAFSRCTGLTSITIPDSVTSIGTGAFYKCTGLKGVYITDLVKWCKIKFDFDYYYEEIEDPNEGNYEVISYDFTSNPLYYAHNLYLNNQLVTDLVIPSSVTSIGDRAFYNCTGLTSITIPDSVTSIGINAFFGCTGLTSVTIGNSVTSIGDYAFSECTKLTSITIPDSVTSIGYAAFYRCTGLTIFGSSGSYAIRYAKNNNIKYQPLDGTLGDCTWTLDDDGTLTISGNGAIADFGSNSTLPWGKGIKSVVIEEGITSIGSYAFYNCTGLTNVTIPGSVTSIGKSAFSGCTGLTGVYIKDLA
ncbi:MAG: leucine-rich repeat domain-containing protein [Ruminococcus sp.]|nr:leucine-rich repeat domain-containing protein [Ruminococcus sp.]